MVIVSVFPLNLKYQGRKDFSPMLEGMLGAWGHHPKKCPEANHGMGHVLLIQVVEMWVKLFQQLHQDFLLPMHFSLMLPRMNIFGISGLFDSEQLVSLDCQLVHLEGAKVFLGSEAPLFFDNAEAALPHSLMTFANQHHLQHFPKALPSVSTQGTHLRTEFLVGEHDCCLLCV